MKCALLNVICHVEVSAWEWWSRIGFLNKSLIVLGLVALIVGLCWSVLSFLKAIGGWPAVIGFLVVVLGIVLALMPHKPKGYDQQTDITGPDAEGPFQFGKDRLKKPPRRGKPSPIPGFDSSTGTWNSNAK